MGTIAEQHRTQQTRQSLDAAALPSLPARPQIRSARPEDVAALQRLYETFFQSEQQYHAAIDPSWAYSDAFAAQMHQRTAEPRCCLFVTERAPVLAAMLFGRLLELPGTPAPAAELTELAVLPEYRRQGLAAGLIDEFLGWCSEKRVGTVRLHVFAANGGARRLYRQAGFYDSLPHSDQMVVQMERRLAGEG